MEVWCLERNNLVMALLTCFASACAHDDAPPTRAPSSIVADVIIAVTNQTSQDKRIFLEAGVKEHPLGVVRGHSTRSFSVPSGAGDSTSDLRLQARQHPFAPVRSGVFRLSSGDRVAWLLDRNGRGRAVTR